MKYEVVTSKIDGKDGELLGDEVTLKIAVDKMIELDWIPQGGVIYVPVGGGVGYFAQAMTCQPCLIGNGLMGLPEVH